MQKGRSASRVSLASVQARGGGRSRARADPWSQTCHPPSATSTHWKARNVSAIFPTATAVPSWPVALVIESAAAAASAETAPLTIPTGGWDHFGDAPNDVRAKSAAARPTARRMASDGP